MLRYTYTAIIAAVTYILMMAITPYKIFVSCYISYYIFILLFIIFFHWRWHIMPYYYYITYYAFSLLAEITIRRHMMLPSLITPLDLSHKVCFLLSLPSAITPLVISPFAIFIYARLIRHFRRHYAAIDIAFKSYMALRQHSYIYYAIIAAFGWPLRFIIIDAVIYGYALFIIAARLILLWRFRWYFAPWQRYSRIRQAGVRLSYYATYAITITQWLLHIHYYLRCAYYFKWQLTHYWCCYATEGGVGSAARQRAAVRRRYMADITPGHYADFHKDADAESALLRHCRWLFCHIDAAIFVTPMPLRCHILILHYYMITPFTLHIDITLAAFDITLLILYIIDINIIFFRYAITLLLRLRLFLPSSSHADGDVDEQVYAATPLAPLRRRWYYVIILSCLRQRHAPFIALLRYFFSLYYFDFINTRITLLICFMPLRHYMFLHTLMLSITMHIAICIAISYCYMDIDTIITLRYLVSKGCHCQATMVLLLLFVLPWHCHTPPRLTIFAAISSLPPPYCHCRHYLALLIRHAEISPSSFTWHAVRCRRWCQRQDAHLHDTSITEPHTHSHMSLCFFMLFSCHTLPCCYYYYADVAAAMPAPHEQAAAAPHYAIIITLHTHTLHITPYYACYFSHITIDISAIARYWLAITLLIHCYYYSVTPLLLIYRPSLSTYTCFILLLLSLLLYIFIITITHTLMSFHYTLLSFPFSSSPCLLLHIITLSWLRPLRL